MTMTRDEIVEATRAFLRSEILHDEAAPLATDEPLLSAGIITSFDLVSLTVFLEQHFGVKVPDSKVSRDFLDTLEQIAALVISLSSSDTTARTETAEADAFSRRAIPSFRNRPFLVIGATLLILLALDRLTGWLVERPAFLEALEGCPSNPRMASAKAAGDRKRMNYAYPSYERALARHELGLTPKGADEIRIVFQGDSGTFGSYLDADEACPAVAGRLLAEKEPRVHVYNVSYFGQTFVKDAEMLEAGLPYRPDVVVVSFCSIHLNRELQEKWWLVPPTTIVYNRDLFTRFLADVPGARERPGVSDLADVLARSEAAHHMDYLHRVEHVSAIVRNQLLLRGGFSGLGFFQPAADGLGAYLSACRHFHGKTTHDVFKNAPYPLDERALTLLEAIIDRARTIGTEVVLFWEPEPTIQGSPPSRIPWNEDGWNALERAIQGVVDRKGVLLVNCRDLLDQDEFLDSERHWTLEGNAKIGQVLAERLTPLMARLASKHR